MYTSMNGSLAASLSARAMSRSDSNGDTSEQYRYATLSQREKQILSMLTRGDSINAIADALKISNKTVSTHKARMVEKMQFSSNAEMIRFGIKHNLS